MNKTQLTVWLFQTGEPIHSDPSNPRPMRAMNTANKLVESGHKVVLWSSTFYHQEKKQRSLDSNTITISDKLEIRLIPSPGYQRNIGLQRLWDHAVLAYNLRKQLKTITEAPDVAFIGYPPIEAAFVMINWLFPKKVPVVLDIKDQWPDVLLNPLPSKLKPIGRIILWPYYFMAKNGMRKATALSAMAHAFLQWSVAFSNREQSENDMVIPLTPASYKLSTKQLYEAKRWWDDLGILDNSTPRFFFIGSHSPAFDFEPIYKAAKYFHDNDGVCEFIICGKGSQGTELRNMMKDLPNIIFPGWIDQAQIVTLAERSYAALAPYKNNEDFMRSIPNKIIDALSLGLPIISPLRGEVENLISQYDVGIFYGPGATTTIEEGILNLIEDDIYKKKLSDNSIKLYRDKFSFEKVYGDLVSHLEKLALEKNKQ